MTSSGRGSSARRSLPESLIQEGAVSTERKEMAALAVLTARLGARQALLTE